jgi:hypothetical protein
MIAQVIGVCRVKGRKIGICGQAPSDYPEFAQFLVEQGIDSISLTPDTVLKTTVAILERRRRSTRREAHAETTNNGKPCAMDGERAVRIARKMRAVMDAENNSEPDTGPCGRCEQCRCGEKGAAPREIGTAVRAVHASLPASITTAQAAVDGTDFRFYPAAGAAS